MERQRWSVDERLEIRTGKLEGTRTYFCLGSRLTLVDSPSVVPLIRAHILGFRIWQLICVGARALLLCRTCPQSGKPGQIYKNPKFQRQKIA